MVVKLGCPTEIPDLLVKNNFTCLTAKSPNLQGSGPVISIFNMPPGDWDACNLQMTTHTRLQTNCGSLIKYNTFILQINAKI